jgi:homocysteine S-methyltransferase
MESNALEPFLRQHGYVVLDGGLATELERRGVDLSGPLWSARVLRDAPEVIEEVHEEYYAAGSDVATTASYQATTRGLEEAGLTPDEADDLIHRSVIVACRARNRFWSDPANRLGRLRPLVAASVGSYGAYLADGSEYRGAYGLTVRELVRFHRRRVEVLADSPADIIAFETIPSAEEAEALVSVLEDLPAGVGVEAWMSFTCRDGAHLADGTPLRSAVQVASSSPRIVAVGVNCTAPWFVTPLLTIAAHTCSLPLVAYPNSGEGWDSVTHSWTRGPQQVDFGAMAVEWHAAGARLIGGCCRTTPDDVAAIGRALKATFPTP